MSYRRIFNLNCSLVLFFFCLSGVSKANPLIADSLVQEGQAQIVAGDLTLAAHELARALLLEIDHEEARKALLGLKRARALPEYIQSQIEEYGELFSLIERQHNDIEDLMFKRTDLTEELLSKGVPKSRIEERLYYWEERAFRNKNRVQDEMNQTLALEKDPLALLNGYMQIEKERKFNKISYLEQQYDDLVNLRYVLASEGIDKDVKSMDIVHTERFYNTRGKPRYKAGTTTVLRFKNFQDMRSHMIRQEEKVDRLSRQIMDLSLRVSEKDIAMKRVEDARVPFVNSTDSDSKEWQSRFELSERIIKRKDEQILNLEESLADYKGLLQEKELLHAQKLRDKESSMEALGEELFAVNVKMERVKKDYLAMTRKQLKKAAGKRLERVESQLSAKSGQLQELEGVLQLYKDLLADTTRTSKQKDVLVEEKDVMIGSLQKDVSRLQGDIARKDRSLEGHRENLENLQAQVHLMQNQLVALEENSDDNPFASPVLEERMIEMKAQLNDINQFIQKELQKYSWPNYN